jgi:hypothetical protein
MNPFYFKAAKWLVPLTICFVVVSCQKQIKEQPGEILGSAANGRGSEQFARNYSSEVALDWMNVQLRIIQSTPLTFGGFNSRYIGYNGVAAYESVVAGMPGYKSLAGQLNGLGSLPAVQHSKNYHWPTSMNAALATMNRGFYTMATPTYQHLIDSLENALNSRFQGQVSTETFNRSKDFGTAIGNAILAWSASDGAFDPHPAYVLLGTPGSWAPTPPPFAPAAGPFYGLTRTLVAGSGDGSTPVPPSPYSADPSSAYYQRMKEVYDVSQSLTPHQIEMGLYYRDNPGLQGGGGAYLGMLYQIVKNEQPTLDQAALDFGKMGIALADALINCWKTKYDPAFTNERPIRYIRNELGHPTWSPLFATPPHPDVPSGHSTNAGAMEIMFNDLFGKDYSFTNHSYDSLGMPPQVYQNFADMAEQIGAARVYAGIHTRYACEVGRKQGNIIARNILRKLKFHDDSDRHDQDEH